MADSRLKLAIIIGSARVGRSGGMVATWFQEETTKHDQFDIEVIDLLETPPPLILRDDVPDELAEVTRKLAWADAFVVVTPEYNHSFPASLKSLIDWHDAEWRAKPVGFVSYGGYAGGLRAVEALRLVFAEMHSVTIRETVSFAMFWSAFSADGTPVDGEGTGTAAKAMLDQLSWWASALREAREKSPYQVES